MTSTLTAHPAYAYTRRQGAYSFAHQHAVIDQALITGRFKRDQGDALCRPAAKFWGLYVTNTGPGLLPPGASSWPSATAWHSPTRLRRPPDDTR